MTILQNSSHLLMNPEIQPFLIVEQIQHCVANLGSISSSKLSVMKKKHQTVFTKSNSQFTFGDGAQVTTVSGAIIPFTIGTTKTKIHVDIVASNIPLLLSKESMKRTNIKLSFENDTVTAFRQPINLVVTKSGHYAIPITNNKQLLNDLNTTHQQITLTLTNSNSDKKKRCNGEF